jgi:hypothetical protein
MLGVSRMFEVGLGCVGVWRLTPETGVYVVV